MTAVIEAGTGGNSEIGRATQGRAYYNEIDGYAAQWLRNLAAAGLIPAGDVDERSIADVQSGDLAGYTQCHFFAGLGGWAYACRLAGWPDDRPIWTGSCPCQPYSVAGKGAGADDPRHLWPNFFRLIGACRPPVVMGEQVAAAVGKGWLDGVFSDLEGVRYACRAVVVPACAVDAPHRRDRLWFVADRKRERCDGRSGLREDSGGRPEFADCCSALADANQSCPGEGREQRSRQLGWPCSDPATGFVVGGDGKSRRVEPSIRLLAHGVPARVAKLRALGNAIVPAVGAEVIAAYAARPLPRTAGRA